MKAFVTSIGEPTTDLCAWTLQRNGFEVVLVEGNDTFWSKLKRIYEMANDDFVRVDADVVMNNKLTPNLIINRHHIRLYHDDLDLWWIQFNTFDWYKQYITTGGANWIKKDALPYLRKHIDTYETSDRPESQVYRLDEFHDPRRCVTDNIVVGLHGFAQNDLDRVKAVKKQRRQYDNYDWELVDKLCQL